MGLDEKNQAYNINADTAAGALAVSLKSRRLLLMTDVEGVLDKNKKLISEIKPKEAEKFINLSHQEIMKIASKLKRKDKNRLLTKNIFVANVISDWEKLKN